MARQLDQDSLPLHFHGYLGTPVFDYVNEVQLRDVAQGLGVDLDLSREVTLTKDQGNSLKATVKVLEVGATRTTGSSHVASRSGALPTAATFAVMARLQWRNALAAVAQDPAIPSCTTFPLTRTAGPSSAGRGT